MATTNHIINLASDCSYAIRPGDRYYVQNLFEELDAPGEWYLDKKAWTLYFWPPAPLAGKPVYVPTLRTILDLGPGAKDVIFRGFTFECCEGSAITLRDTTNCLIAASIIRNVGDYHGNGVTISGGMSNGVVGCDISAIGRDGVVINGGNQITLTPANNFADNNYIHHVGVSYKQGCGISLNGCGNRASHNLIHDGPRFGILLGGNNQVIEYNHIRDMSLETEDTGAIYTGGRDWLGSRGSVIRYNYIHDMIGYGHDQQGVWQSPYFAWGIYLDDNTGGVDVIGNIVARCPRAAIHLHNGRDNFIDNNIFIEGRQQQIEYNGWTKNSDNWKEYLPTMIKGYASVAGQPAWQSMRNMKLNPTNAVLPDATIMSGNVFTHNILYYTNSEARLYACRNVSFAANQFDSNLVWHANQPLLTGIKRHRPATSGRPGKLAPIFIPASPIRSLSMPRRMITGLKPIRRRSNWVSNQFPLKRLALMRMNCVPPGPSSKPKAQGNRTLVIESNGKWRGAMADGGRRTTIIGAINTAFSGGGWVYAGQPCSPVRKKWADDCGN